MNLNLRVCEQKVHVSAYPRQRVDEEVVVVAIKVPIDHQHLIIIGREAQRRQELRSRTIAAKHTLSQNLLHAHLTAQRFRHAFSLTVGRVATAFSAKPERVPVKAQTSQQSMASVPPRRRYEQTEIQNVIDLREKACFVLHCFCGNRN